MSSITWEEYEEEILRYIESKFEGCKVTKNRKIKGKSSGVDRQIDILIETQIADVYLPIVVECKNWSSKLDVADVGSFITTLKDIGIPRGLMISKLGYSQGAYNMASSENDLQLFVLDFENLPDNIGFWGNAYRGNSGAIFSAPTGWIIDNDLNPEEQKTIGLCLMYPMGMKKEKAAAEKEFMFFNLFPFEFDVNELAEEQNRAVKLKDKKSKIEMWEETTPKGSILMRKIYYAKDNYTEFTAFVGTDRFHAFLIAVSKNESEEKNLAKLKYVIRNTHFFVIADVDPTNSHGAWQNFFNMK